MGLQKSSKKVFLPILTGSLLLLWACDTMQQEEAVNIMDLLPTGAVTEITQAYPDFKVTLVSEDTANVSLQFGDKFFHISGVEDEAARERMAKYILQYMENPNKKTDDWAKRKAYDSLPPKEKLADLIERIKSNNPDFDYKWVGLGEGNVKVEYGDNSLVISGVENDGTKEGIAHAIMRIQKDIDKLSKGDVEE